MAVAPPTARGIARWTTNKVVEIAYWPVTCDPAGSAGEERSSQPCAPCARCTEFYLNCGETYDTQSRDILTRRRRSMPTTDRQRVVFCRIQSLATKTSERASASLHFANAQVIALAAQMEARRKAVDR